MDTIVQVDFAFLFACLQKLKVLWCQTNAYYSYRPGYSYVHRYNSFAL